MPPHFRAVCGCFQAARAEWPLERPHGPQIPNGHLALSSVLIIALLCGWTPLI